MEYKSRRMQYGIEKDISLTKFLKPDAYPNPDSIKFVEEREFVRCFINETSRIINRKYNSRCIS